MLPGFTHEMPVLVQFHVHDADCTAADRQLKVVVDRAMQYGASRIAPPFLAAPMLLPAQAGPRALIDGQPHETDMTWERAVRFATADGLETWTEYLDYVDGAVHGGR